MPSARWIIPCITLLLTLLALSLAATVTSTQVRDPSDPYETLHLDHAGNFAPQDMVLTSGEEETSNLNTLMGRKLIIHFWGLSCPNCKSEWRDLKTLAETAKKEQIMFLPIFAGSPDQETEARQFLSTVPGHFPFWIAGPGLSRDRFLAYGLPITYFILPSGQTAARAVGTRGWASEPNLAGLLHRLYSQMH